jgi:phosphoglycolate phosphatase-like HAD superfamily hydrolase
MTERDPILAIIWDFDGTLVDTRQKNLNVNRQIVESITNRPWEEFPELRDVAAYDEAWQGFTNWRDFYGRGIGLTESDINRAAGMWTGLQLADTTEAPFFDGITTALTRLHENIVQGIVSQNSRQNIEKMLDQGGVLACIDHIVGYEEVGTDGQKPAPDGLLMCIERLADSAQGLVLYVGDHETDALCARNADRVLAKRGIRQRVVSVEARFNHAGSVQSWSVEPDHRAISPADVVKIFDVLLAENTSAFGDSAGTRS